MPGRKEDLLGAVCCPDSLLHRAEAGRLDVSLEEVGRRVEAER